MNEQTPPGSEPQQPTEPTASSGAPNPAMNNTSMPDPVDPTRGLDAASAAEQAYAQTEEAVQKVSSAMGQATPPVIPDLAAVVAAGDAEGIGLLEDVQLQVRIELGRTRMLVEDVLRLGSGAVVELDKAAGDPVDIYVNGRRIARGEVLVLNENFCVRVSEIVDPQARTA